MKPFDAFLRLISRVLILDRWKRPENNVPGKVVESMSSEDREALSQLKSDDISDLRVEEYWMMGSDYDRKLANLEFEKKIGIEPPPRKKYEG